MMTGNKATWKPTSIGYIGAVTTTGMLFKKRGKEPELVPPATICGFLESPVLLRVELHGIGALGMRGEVRGVFAEAGEDIAGELGEWFSSLREEGQINLTKIGEGF